MLGRVEIVPRSEDSNMGLTGAEATGLGHVVCRLFISMSYPRFNQIRSPPPTSGVIS
jgi:hypothetical protein